MENKYLIVQHGNIFRIQEKVTSTGHFIEWPQAYKTKRWALEDIAVMSGKASRWPRPKGMEKPVSKLRFGPLDIKQCITVRYLPWSNTKPARFVVKIGEWAPKTFSIGAIPEDLDDRDRAQFLAEKRLNELGLKWEITGAGYLHAQGLTIFTINGKV